MSDETRYRCAHCGNKTRFDVFETVRRRRFEHFTLGGEVAIEDEEILERTVERVVCRWCDRADNIEIIDGHIEVIDGHAGEDRGGTAEA